MTDQERLERLERTVDRELVPWLGSELGYRTPGAPGNVNRRSSDNYKMIVEIDKIIRGGDGNPGLMAKVHRLDFLVLSFAIGFGVAIGVIFMLSLYLYVQSQRRDLAVMTPTARTPARLPHAGDTRIEQAAILSRLAAACYRTDAHLERRYRDAVLSAGGQWVPWRNGSAMGVAGRVDDTVAIAIAGTNDRRDMMLDLDCGQVAAGRVAREHDVPCYGPESMVLHRGFANYTMLCLSALQRLDFDYDGAREYYITGHSLGGAAATYLPLFVESKQSIATVVVTFGAPRCIGRSCVDAHPYRVLRIVRNTDPVPMVPRLQYHHPVGSDQRVMRYPGDLSMTRNLFGYAMAAVHYANPSRCMFAQARRGHSAASYAVDMEPLTPEGVS